MQNIRDKENGKKEIYDPIRKKHVALTPEEAVRQFIINFLHKQLSIPLGCIGVENECKINGLCFRTDLQVFNRYGEVVWIIECKRRGYNLGEDVIDQIGRYSLGKDIRFLMISNGEEFYCWEKNKKEAQSVGLWLRREALPIWEEIR